MRKFAVIACAAVVGVVVAAQPATAQPAAASAREHYVALGDSYSSGSGAGDYSGECRRSANAFPRLWADQHAPASFVFAACSGATTSDVLARQIEQVRSDTTLVSISVGGNDIGFSAVLTTCALSPDVVCAAAVDVAATVARAELPARLDGVHAAIQDRAPNARVVVLGYPRLFTDDVSRCSTSPAKRRALNRGADVLAEVIAERAAAAGAVYEDVRDDFSGHEICSGEPWINAVTWDAISDSYHPTKAGHAYAYLPAFAKAAG